MEAGVSRDGARLTIKPCRQAIEGMPLQPVWKLQEASGWLLLEVEGWHQGVLCVLQKMFPVHLGLAIVLFQNK